MSHNSSTSNRIQRAIRFGLEEAGIKPKTVVVDAAGTPITANRRNGIEKLRWRAHTERDVLERFADEVERGDVVWDIGAALGLHACVARRQGADVVAIEPQPGLLPVLTKHLDLNHRDGTDAEVVSVALAEKNGTLVLSHAADESVATGTVSVCTDETRHGGVRVVSRRGDSLVYDGVAPPDIIKIDVEGAEGLVIDGLSDTLSGDDAPRAVFSEVHLPVSDGRRPSLEDFGSSADDYLQTLSDHGYHHELLSDRAQGEASDELYVLSSKHE